MTSRAPLRSAPCRPANLLTAGPAPGRGLDRLPVGRAGALGHAGDGPPRCPRKALRGLGPSVHGAPQARSANALAACAVVATVLALAGVALAAPREVVLRDGRSLVGEVTPIEGGFRVVLPLGAVEVPIDQIVQIRPYSTPGDELARRWAELAPRDARGRYRLAQWARDGGLLSEAEALLAEAVAIRPDYENAQLLLALVRRERAQTQPATAPARSPATQPTIRPSQPVLLGPDDVARIRLEELRSHDRLPVEFRNDVIERFLDRVRGQGRFAQPGYEARFRRQGRLVQVIEMLETDPLDDALKADIRILNDPASLAQFRRRVWPIYRQGCATDACHGGVKSAGGLRLFAQDLVSEAQDYTNFHTLDTHDSPRGRLIDRGLPDQSLLLQFGLPAGRAMTAHPVKIRPLFYSKDDAGYRLVEAWIGSLLYPRGEYALPSEAPQAEAEAPEAPR